MAIDSRIGYDYATFRRNNLTRASSALSTTDASSSPKRINPTDLQDWGVADAISPQSARKTPDRGSGIEVVPPLAFKGLKTGPDFGVEYEQAEALPVSSSSEILRNLSPFTIQVEPPLVFGNIEPYGRGRPKRVGVFEAAAAASGQSYSYSRDLISQAPYTQLGFGGTVQEVMARNSTGLQNRGPADGTPKRSPTGQGATGRMGEPAIVDLNVAVDIAMQLSAVFGTPPLILLINPQSLQITYSKIQQFQDRSRHGYIFQAWGEEQPKLMISARIGAFIAGGKGVQFASRRDSMAFQNLMSVLLFYKNNGYIHDTVGRSNAHHHVGALSIRYDKWVYYGHMQSMSFTVDDTNQLGGWTFELNFTVSAMLDTGQNVTVVQPMRAPNPNPGDPRLSRGSGTIAIGSQDSVDVFVSQFTGGRSNPAMGAHPSPDRTRPTSQSVNTGGFQPAAALAPAQAQQAPVNSFGLKFPFTLSKSGVGLP